MYMYIYVYVYNIYIYIYMYIMYIYIYIYIYILTCNSQVNIYIPHLLKCKMCDESRHRFNNYESKPRRCQDSKP